MRISVGGWGRLCTQRHQNKLCTAESTLLLVLIGTGKNITVETTTSKYV